MISFLYQYNSSLNSLSKSSGWYMNVIYCECKLNDKGRSGFKSFTCLWKTSVFVKQQLYRFTVHRNEILLNISQADFSKPCHGFGAHGCLAAFSVSVTDNELTPWAVNTDPQRRILFSELWD